MTAKVKGSKAAAAKAPKVKSETVHSECAPAGSKLSVTATSDGRVVITVNGISVTLSGDAE